MVKKKALYSPIGSKGVKNREKRNKIGLKKHVGWFKRSIIHQKWVEKALNGHMCGEKGYQSMKMVKNTSLIGRRVVKLFKVKSGCPNGSESQFKV